MKSGDSGASLFTYPIYFGLVKPVTLNVTTKPDTREQVWRSLVGPKLTGRSRRSGRTSSWPGQKKRRSVGSVSFAAGAGFELAVVPAVVRLTACRRRTLLGALLAHLVVVVRD